MENTTLSTNNINKINNINNTNNRNNTNNKDNKNNSKQGGNIIIRKEYNKLYIEQDKKETKSNYKIEDLVIRIDERNSDISVKNLLGLSIEKCFIKSVANTVGTDLSKYKIIRNKDFAVSLMQVSRDQKIPVAMQEEYDIAIMSPAYHIFRIKDERIILPEFLDLWFKRPEFDREASFIAVGGVRGSMPWNEFSSMVVPVPSIERQREIVNAYRAIMYRIALKKRINDNLAA